MSTGGFISAFVAKVMTESSVEQCIKEGKVRIKSKFHQLNTCTYSLSYGILILFLKTSSMTTSLFFQTCVKKNVLP